MPLSVLCDEHIKYYIIEGLRRQGVDAVSVQQVHLDATDDELIISAANQLGRVIYTCDDDFVRINSTGIPTWESFTTMPLNIPSAMLFAP